MYSKNLKKIKEILQKTTDQIAQDTGIPARTLGGYERNERTPSIELPLKLLSVYNINANWFLSGVGAVFSKINDLKKTEPIDLHNCVELFCKRLKEIQTKNKLLDREMAKILRISENYYMNLYTGREHPTLEIINKIKENFRVDIDWLLYGYDSSGTSDNITSLQSLSPEQFQKLLKLLDNN